MEKGDLIIFRQAKAIELKRFRGYSKKAKQTTSNSIREVFVFLSKAEKKHYEILRDYEKILKEGRLSKIKVKSIKLENSASRKHIKNIGKMTADIEVILEAERMEESDIYFYKIAIKKAKDKKVKEILRKIEKQEEYHRQVLKKRFINLKDQDMALLASQDPRIGFYNLMKSKSF